MHQPVLMNEKIVEISLTVIFGIKVRTRWTFFRVKLVFESDFEISWSLCPWDPWTFGLLDYNVSSGPFLSYEIEIGDGPGPELDNL